MNRQIYHGSDHVIAHPTFGLGNPHNDYGLGFYCTESLDMAREWGVDRTRDGVVNAYDIDAEGLAVLNLSEPGYCVLHWLAVLLDNRTFDMRSPLAAEARAYVTARFAVPYADADVIIGWRADDSYFAFAQDFLDGAISVRQLNVAMRLGKLGEQVVLKSMRAFDRLRFVGSEGVPCSEWYPRKELRDRLARREYLQGERYARRRGDLYVTNLMDEGVDADDPRLR